MTISDNKSRLNIEFIYKDDKSKRFPVTTNRIPFLYFIHSPFNLGFKPFFNNYYPFQTVPYIFKSIFYGENGNDTNNE